MGPVSGMLVGSRMVLVRGEPGPSSALRQCGMGESKFQSPSRADRMECSVLLTDSLMFAVGSRSGQGGKSHCKGKLVSGTSEPRLPYGNCVSPL